MIVTNLIKCLNFPCSDIDKASYNIPDIEIEPSKIRVVIVAEAPPTEKADYFYA